MENKHSQLSFILNLHSSSDPNLVINNIIQNKSLFTELINSNLNRKQLIDVFKLLICVGNSTLEIHKKEIFNIAYEFLFMDTDNVQNCLCEMKNCNISLCKDDLKVIINLFDIIINDMPRKYYSLFLFLFMELKNLIGNVSLQNFDSEKLLVDDLNELLQCKILKLAEENCKYIDIATYPTPVDFFEKKILTPNKLDSTYKHAQEYLDIHYKLMKEDYESAVRDGINQYRRELRGAIKTVNQNIKVFKGVTIHSIECSDKLRQGIVHTIKLSRLHEKYLIEEEANNTKLLMTGQLLYFSSHSNFTTFAIAALVESNASVADEKGNMHRALIVSVIGDIFALKVKQNYTMIVPKAFFDPYLQTLETFKFIKPSEFPMKKYIIHKDFTPRKPSYLRNDLDIPKAFISNLNVSQLAAVKAALSNEFILIQGPPGTGKSHVVKTIIKILIHFRNMRASPILLVCSRNNSLDHVLEPLAENGINVIRLGGQTQSNILKNCKPQFKQINAGQYIGNIKSLKNIIDENIDECSLGKIQELQKAIKYYIKLTQSSDAAGIKSGNIMIVGATTNGAAKLHYMLSKLKPEVVIIEEAAEVFEAFAVSSMPLGCKHVILVGDHKQLQPNPSHMDSTVKYNLNTSLFERLIDNGMKCHTLTEQHRMRPEIASLISPLIYTTLTNHHSVLHYPDVRGMTKNLYFFDHNIPERNEVQATGYSNKFEGNMLIGLANYLTKHNYSPSDITIIAAYSLQVAHITKALANYPNLKGIKVTSIDNYQGEENIIILLSLVRSGSSSIGFLEKPNRVNVALSRAKHGLYIIGNMKTLSSRSLLWKNIQENLRKLKSIGRSFQLKCLHEKITEVKNLKGFSLLNKKGCSAKCDIDIILKCGHMGPDDDSKCNQPCSRIICKAHITKCTRRCYETCIDCPRIINVDLKCGHNTTTQCKSGKISTILCHVLVRRHLDCGHSHDLPCSHPLKSFKCQMNCQRFCSEGHLCTKTCSENCGPCEESVVVCCFFTGSCGSTSYQSMTI